jgi:thiamine-phosphate diphosphorylase
MNKEQLLLYAVTDRAWLNGDTLENAVEKALSGGVTMLQLREKNMPTEDFIKSARKIKSICKNFNVPLIINDNIEVAAAVDADGVHLGQGDTPLVEARRILGNDKIIGITAKTTEQALTAEKNGADYLGSGAVFGTSTKSNAIKMELDTCCYRRNNCG